MAVLPCEKRLREGAITGEIPASGGWWAIHMWVVVGSLISECGLHPPLLPLPNYLNQTHH